MKRERPASAQVSRELPYASCLATADKLGVPRQKLQLMNHDGDLSRAFDRWMRFFEFDPTAAAFFFNLDPDSLPKRH